MAASVHPSAPPPVVAHWRRHLPPAPKLPRAFWLTGGVMLLALLSYGFRAEIWPNHPAVGKCSLLVLPSAMVAGMLQVLNSLQRWIVAATSPGWWRLLLRAAVLLVQVGMALLIMVFLLASLVVLILA